MSSSVPLRHTARAAANPFTFATMGLALLIGLLTGCETTPPVEASAAAWYESAVVDAGVAPSVPGARQIDVYFDFSDGMGEGMRAASAVNLELINFLKGRDTRVFRVGATQEPTLMTLGDRGSDLLDLRNYSDKASFLRPPLDSVIAHPERASLYVTDFERVLEGPPRVVAGAPRPHSLDVTAWGQDAFQRWLAAGNRLDIFAFPYQKRTPWFGGGTIQNYIYYIVFTPRAEASDPIAMRSSLLQFLNDRFETVAGGGAHFSYWADDIVRDTVPRGPPLCHGNQDLQLLDCATLNPDRSPEWYWVTSDGLLDFQQNAAITDKRLFTALIEPRIAFLQGAKIGMRVSEMTPALLLVGQYLADSAQWLADSVAAHPDVTDPSTGQSTLAPKPMRPDAATLTGEVATGVFSWVANEATHEIGVTLDPNFGGVQQSTVYRIELVLEAGTLADQSVADAVLLLNYSSGYQIRALGESLKFALRDIVTNLAGRPLHTVYVRIDP